MHDHLLASFFYHGGTMHMDPPHLLKLKK